MFDYEIKKLIPKIRVIVIAILITLLAFSLITQYIYPGLRVLVNLFLGIAPKKMKSPDFTPLVPAPKQKNHVISSHDFVFGR